MIIIAGYTLSDAAMRDASVTAHQDMVRRARAFDGCIDLAITADPIDPRRSNNFELWRDQAALDAWRKVANPPVPAFDEARVHLYRTDKQESPF